MSWLIYVLGLAVVAAVAALIAGPLLRQPATATGAPRGRSGDRERYRLEKEKELAYGAIKEAQFDYQMGKLSADDYAELRRKYEARALAALAALERRS